MVAAGVVSSLLIAVVASAHPLHTTLTELTVDRTHHTVRAVVRVFADDIAAATAHRANARVKPGQLATDADAVSYVLTTLTMSASGATVSLKPCGVKRSGNLLWVCAEGAVGDLRTLSLDNSVLRELYADQVNIVQLTNSDGVPTKSILFTRGDRAKMVL